MLFSNYIEQHDSSSINIWLPSCSMHLLPFNCSVVFLGRKFRNRIDLIAWSLLRSISQISITIIVTFHVSIHKRKIENSIKWNNLRWIRSSNFKLHIMTANLRRIHFHGHMHAIKSPRKWKKFNTITLIYTIAWHIVDSTCQYRKSLFNIYKISWCNFIGSMLCQRHNEMWEDA